MATLVLKGMAKNAKLLAIPVEQEMVASGSFAPG
jgi:hypothetical protein